MSKRGEYLTISGEMATTLKGCGAGLHFESYRTDSPDWDIILDLDALAKEEEEN